MRFFHMPLSHNRADRSESLATFPTPEENQGPQAESRLVRRRVPTMRQYSGGSDAKTDAYDMCNMLLRGL